MTWPLDRYVLSEVPSGLRQGPQGIFGVFSAYASFFDQISGLVQVRKEQCRLAFSHFPNPHDHLAPRNPQHAAVATPMPRYALVALARFLGAVAAKHRKKPRVSPPAQAM